MTERVSLSSSGAQVDGDSINPVISGDRRYVAFWSEVPDLDPAHPAKEVSAPLYVRDLQAGTTELVSLGSDGDPARNNGGWSALSEDGRFVVFDSPNRLTPDDTDKRWDVFIRDRVEQTTTLVSAGSFYTASTHGRQAVSADGRLVVFVARRNQPGVDRLYVRDTSQNTTRVASVTRT